MPRLNLQIPGENKTRTSKFILTSLICLILSAGCSYPFIRTVEVTRVVRQTVVVTEILVAVETVTPLATGPNPAATTLHPFEVWSTKQVEDTLLAAGLEVGNPRAMTSDDYGLVPMLAVEGRRFFIPSICSDCGGRIMSFANERDLAIVRDYYAQMSGFGAVLFSWVFVKDNILVQINGELPEENARMYEAALANMK